MTKTTRLTFIFFVVFLTHGLSASDYFQRKVIQHDLESLSDDNIELNLTARGKRVRRSPSFCEHDRTGSRIDCGWPGIPSERCTEMDCCADTTRPSYHCYIKYGGDFTQHGSCDFSNPVNRRTECGYPGITKTVCEQRGCCYDNRVANVKHCFHYNSASPPKVSTTTASPPIVSTTIASPLKVTTTAASPEDVCCDAISKSHLKLLITKMDIIKKSIDSLNQRCQ